MGKSQPINATAFSGDAHINLSDKQRAELQESVVEQTPLFVALTELVHASAEYSHPCDADELRLDKATGSVSIQELRELLAAHKHTP